MGKTNTKKMVQGAMIAAMFGALSLFNTYTGSMFDIFICYAMVIPLTWYGYTYSLKDNVIVCFVAMIVITMMGLPFFVISSLSSCLSGLFIGECLRRKSKKEMILLGTFAVSFLNNILLYEVFSGLLGIDLITEMTQMYETMIDTIPSLTTQIPLDTFLSFIPIVLVIMSVMEMYVIIMLCQLVLARLKIEFPGSFHIATMHLSYRTGVVLAIAMFGAYILTNFAGINNIYLSYVYTLSTLIFGLQGLAFICYLLILKKKPKYMILAFIGVIVPILNMIYVALGILDIFSDLRENILYNSNNND